MVLGLPADSFRSLPTSEPFFPYKSCVIGVCESFKEPSPFLFDLPSTILFTTSVGINSFGIPNLSFTLSLRPPSEVILPGSPFLPPVNFDSPLPINPPSPASPPVLPFIFSKSGVERCAIRVASFPYINGLFISTADFILTPVSSCSTRVSLSGFTDLS